MLEMIQLKRFGKKEWQYKDCPIKRVELAALDYFQDHGWDGYFTEHYDYDATLIVMMCWGDHSKLPKYSSDISNFSIMTPNCLFDKSADGIWQYNNTYDWNELITNAENFTPDKIKEILELWVKRKIKGFFIGRSSHKPRQANELLEKNLIAYFNAKGGKRYFLELIKNKYPQERYFLSKRAKEIFTEIKSSYRDKGENKQLFGLAGELPQILGISRNDELNFESLQVQIKSCEPCALREKFAELIAEIEIFRSTEDQFSRNLPIAELDLVIWKEGEVVNVEIKAPNDRLRPNQKQQLLWDKARGRKSIVVNVQEA